MIACDWKDFYDIVEAHPEEEYVILIGSKEAIDTFDGMIPVIPSINRAMLSNGDSIKTDDPSMYSCVGAWPLTRKDHAILLQKMFLVTPDLSEVDEAEF